MTKDHINVVEPTGRSQCSGCPAISYAILVHADSREQKTLIIEL